ncbi:MAG: AI-2E family transporter [Lachnospiraceae bacterium]
MNKQDNFIPPEEEKLGRKFKDNFAKYGEIGVVCFCVVAACLLFYYLLFKFAVVKKGIGIIISVISPIIVGFVFAYILNPIVMFLEEYFMKIYQKHKQAVARSGRKKTKQSQKPKKIKPESDDNSVCTNQNPMLVNGRKVARRISILITVVVVVTLVGLLATAVIPAFARSVSSLAEKLPYYYTTVSEAVISFVNKHEWISRQLPDVNKILESFNIFEILSNYINSLLSTAYNWVIVAFKIVYNVLIGLIIAIYLLGGKERYIGQAKKITYALMKPEHAKRFVQNMHNTNLIFKSAILGKILDSIIIGCLCFIGMSILGMFGLEAIGNNRVLLSVVIGVTNVIPFFGPYIGGIPSVFLVFCENPVHGLVFAIFVVVLQQFDCNFLDPRVVGNSVGLSPLYVLSFCLIGGGLFGIVGMLVATPTGAVIYGFTKSWIESRLEAKELPVKTADYAEKPGANKQKA